MEHDEELIENEEETEEIEETSTDEVEENEPDYEEPVSLSDSSVEANPHDKTIKTMKFLAKNPWLIPILIVFICFFTVCVLIATDETKVKASGNICTYKISGLDKNSVVTIEDPQVELINCDATKDNFKVLKTISFEKYVLGVALAEAGDGINDEALKAQIITTRTFTLARGLGMCPSNPANCWLGYNQEQNIIRVRACEKDQVYWDYTEDIYHIVTGDGTGVDYYSPEISASDSGATIWKSKLTDERIAEVEAIADQVMGTIMVDSSGNIIEADYNNTDSTYFLNQGDAGKKYNEILTSNYAEKYGTISFATASCTSKTSVGNIDYGDYSLSSEGDVILNHRLDSFLESQGSSLEEYNNTILNNINNAGYGTRAGVVAAAVTLIGELGDKYDIRLPYYWGGGHSSISNLASADWGDEAYTCNNSGTCYYINGLDCSGFVSWAIYNGGFNLTAQTTNNFYRLVNQKTSLSSSTAVLEPGDLLESSSHVVLVISVDEENKKYITAEAAQKSEGIKFGSKSFAPNGYWGVKLDDFYNNTSNIRS